MDDHRNLRSGKAPSIDIFGLQHLVVEGLLNFVHNAPSSGRFYKLANQVDARDKKFRQRAFFDCIPSASYFRSSHFPQAHLRVMGSKVNPGEKQSGESRGRSIPSVHLRFMRGCHEHFQTRRGHASRDATVILEQQ